MSLEKLHREIQACRKCNLSKTRVNAVPGEGSPDAEIMFVGQNPGRNEDIQGKPFVGLAGRMFDELLDSVELRREEVFITGAVKCHTPRNRKPTSAEIGACRPYLLTQIEIVNPKIIILLGEVALKALLNEKDVGKLHGRIVEKEGVVYLPTFHPAAAMRFPKVRERIRADFEQLRDLQVQI